MANINEWEEICQAWNLTGNKYLDGDTNENNNSEQNFRKALLNATAKGTEEYSYLDPIPFINRIKQCYTNLTKNIGNIESARTDSIEMNRDNMDYTNDSDPQVGLNLLMPQYHRRVEVEDLDENFWVIGNVLDAVVSSLWRTNGIVDMIGELVERIIIISDYLGLSNISGVDVLHGDTDDLTFNMFTRFTLNGLKIRLHSNTGERIIGDFIRQYNENSLPAADYYNKGNNEAAGEGISSTTYDSLDDYYLAFNKLINYGTGENGKGRREGIRDAEIIFAKSETGTYYPLFGAIDTINGKKYENPTIASKYNVYFDVDGSGAIDANDAQQLADDVEWMSRHVKVDTSTLEKYIDEADFDKLDTPTALKDRLTTDFYKQLKAKANEEDSIQYLKEESNWTTYLIRNSEDTEVHIPTIRYAALLAGILAGNRDNPFDPLSTINIDDTTEPDDSNEYRTQGQLLIFLYSKNFYDFSIDSDNNYILSFKHDVSTAKRSYIFNTREKVSDLNLLFIPRSDLIEGEILQLSIRKEGLDNSYTCQFPTDGRDVVYQTPEIDSTNFPFLSLHNVFAQIPQRYNYRTTLMFKNTSPEFSLDKDNLSKLKDSNEKFDFDRIFQNGVYIQYHNAEDSSGKSTTLPFVVRFKASMIAQNNRVTPSNCFIREVTIPSTTDATLFKNISIVSKEYYTAGNINNLMFYGTGSQMENNIPIHTNLNLLHSEDIKGYDETIQGGPSTTYGDKSKLADIFSKKTDESTIDDLLKQFSFNSLEGRPSHFEICFHRRYVDNYVKRKKLKYIVIKKEKGESWHENYKIKQIGISAFLFKHPKNDTQTIMSICELASDKIQDYFKWVKEDSKDVYGVLNFEAILNDNTLEEFFINRSADGYIIRFYSYSNESSEKTLFKCPRASMIYFLGEDASGDSIVLRPLINTNGGNS